jgi:aspartyl-tRNA(Asn)/glutamyl-tRNA(Gln) amidotransferase subunit A
MVSRYGLVAFGSSLDQIGPFTRSVRDAAVLMDVIAGHDPKDSTSADQPPMNFESTVLEGSLKGVRLGIPTEYFAEGLEDGVRKVVESAIERMRGLGAETVEISLPHTQYAVPTYYIIATAEASSNLARYDGVHYGHRTEQASDIICLFSSSREEAFGDEVKRRIMLGTYALSAGYYDAYYLRAQKVRNLITQDLTQAFEQVDLIVSPVSPTVAFKRGERDQDPLAMYLSDIYTIGANLSGIPAVSLPAGMSEGMPVGLQIMGGHLQDAKVLAAAYALEQELALGYPVAPLT